MDQQKKSADIFFGAGFVVGGAFLQGVCGFHRCILRGFWLVERGG
jgi:hypothetical protein